MRKHGWLVLGMVAALIAVSGVALAQPEDDTLLNYAYDPVNYLIVYHSSALDTVDCTPPGGTVTATYGTFANGSAPVTDLVPANGYDLDACPTAAWFVMGPQGQVNHGQVVRTFGHSLEDGHQGCLLRWIARSGFGKDTDQVRTPDGDPDFEPGSTGDVEFMSQMVNCHGGAQSGPVSLEGPSSHPGGNRGNSANAPGHNK